ncbi:MAG TPA: arsenate reductase ArsC [Chloroflexota bacterium]|nr:arsenate reductase ArsC [Chloroflexota bacterium]
MADSPTIRVLFLCTHNSARSQMAEGLLRELGGGRYEVASAGTEQTHVRPEAVAVMRERGIDISAHTSKTLDRFLGQAYDYVITVCDRANEACPNFPFGAHRLHWSFPDPAAVPGAEAERLAAFRQVRDAIEGRIREFLKLPAEAPA